MSEIRRHDSLTNRILWFIRLRWIAIASVVATVYFVPSFLKIPLRVFPFYSIAFILAAYNAVFFFLVSRIKRHPDRARFANGIANLQIFFDLFCLAALIHFSGGIENPFIFYFIFHMIIASIVLTRRAAFLQASYAVALFLSVVFLEYSGFLPHYPLQGFLPVFLYDKPAYILGIAFVFISTLYISVYMATSISLELREREKSLERANALLEEKDRIKSEYVLRVTHDIKEDLSAVESCISPVTDGTLGVLNDSQKNLLSRAQSRARQLIAFVNALLTITRLKLKQKLEMESFSFPSLIWEVADTISARAKNKNITFRTEVKSSLENLKGVKVYLQEALLNILANAIKYTPPGGKVTFEIIEKEHLLLIFIKDTGIGIPKEALPHIFEEFYRAKNARAIERSGTGLGLSLAKQIIEMHNGKITVESQEGKGTIFYIELPK